MSGQGNCFFRNPFHQAAVAVDDISVMITEFVAKAGIKYSFGQSHAHSRGNSLPQGAGGHVNAGEVTVFGMTGGFGTQLAEVFYIINGYILITQQV